MNLRNKTFLIILAVGLICSIVMAFFISNFTIKGYQAEEIQITKDKVGQINAQIEAQQQELAGINKDWAEWDDTYQYTIDKNPEFIQSNFVYATFFNNHINFAAIIDLKGNWIYSVYYAKIQGDTPDVVNLIPVNVPPELLSYLADNSPFLIQNKNHTGTQGYINLPYSPMFLVSHPILTSDASGDSRGTLLLGRYLDQPEIQRFPGTSRLNPEGFKFNDPALPIDFSNITPKLSKDNPIIVRALDDQIVAGYRLISDINGQPCFIIRIETPRDIYSRARNAVPYYAISLIIFVLLFIAAILIILERMVISRVASLSSKIKLIGRKGDLSTRVALTGKDEISSLAESINGMMDNIEQSRRSQKESETFNLALLNGSPSAIEVLNPDGSIRFVNPALETLTGYTQAQIIGRKPPYPWWPDDLIQKYNQEFIESLEGGVRKSERKFLKPDNRPFWIELTSTTIKQSGKAQFVISNWVDITERKKTYEALIESEKRFRKLVELLPELVFETDLDGKLTFVNRIAFSAFGYLPEEHSTLRLLDFIAQEDQTFARHNLKLIIEGEELGNTEYTAISKNDRRFPVFIHATQISDAAGAVTGLRGILVDISRLKEIEAELRASEEYSTSLLTNAPNPIIVANPDFSISYINPALESLTGYTNAEVVGSSPPLLWWPSEKAQQYLIEDSSISEDPQLVKERYYRKKNGDVFWVNIYLKPIKEDGVTKYYLSNWVDITESKRVGDALRESEEFSSSLRDYSPFPIMVINPDTSIRYVNPALEKLSGFSAAELMGQKTPYSFFREDPQQKPAEIFPANMQSSHGIEALFKKNSGESFYIDITSTPIMENAQLKYILSIWVDITAQKLANQQLEQLYQREKTVREALQVEIKSRTEFTRALVHELKTPLTPIMASSELLVEELTEEPLLGLAKNVYRGAENMNRRVDELLDLARGEVGILKVNPNPVDPENMLREALKYMEPFSRNNGQTLVLNLPGKLPIIIADEDRVKQVLFNLISNSIKYSSQDGEIKISAFEKDNELVIEVTDQGRGMTGTEQEKLFEPYYRIEGNERLSGLGLGLALSKKLIELQKGRIWANSQKGKGSTFSFTLPIRTETPNETITKFGGIK